MISLTNPQLVVETFGLTPLEAMSAGLPVIVPTVGGIAELVDDGENGYKTDVLDLDVIEKQIDDMLTDKALYDSMAKGTLKRAKKYQPAETLSLLMKSIENGKKQHEDSFTSDGRIYFL